MFRAVLDTTVLVAALLRPEPGGVSAELLRHAADGKYELFLSDDILEETAATLMRSERNKRRYKYSDELVVEYCEKLAHIGTVVADIPALSGIVRDPNDDMIVACAVAAKADFLVSRDKDLLALGSYSAIDMATPEAFLRLLRESGLS
jgi:putative PIN family toxin of toxin-antitoxin system